MNRTILYVLATLALMSCATTNKKNKQSFAPPAAIVKADTTKKMKAYHEVITSKAVSKKGLINVHVLNDRWFFELADSLLNKDILVVNRISKAAAEATGIYGGDWIGENVIRFVKGPKQKIFIQRISYRDRTKDSSENGMYRSVLNSSLQPIVASFDIRATTPDSTGSVIDVTDYLNGDNEVFFFDPRVKKEYKLAGLQADKSYISGILSFPMNTEIKTIKTYTAGILNQLFTYELNSSLVLLPSHPMTPRYADDRLGYFSRGYINYDAPQQLNVDYMITRWRLEPKKEDEAKYRRGELVEPQKPIVFYIDPATPKKWVPYLIEGVNAWKKVFEKAGFKNAIHALEVPATDTAWSLEDARHSVIVYKASPIQNASGPQVSDPRSGEILESHINWYHNVQQVLRDWYFIQSSPNDPEARRINFDDALMGKLIRMVCTHEVGHTLGLMHNFMASSTVPVDSLRSKQYVAKNGHTPSIMDYARFNYVAQPEDQIPVDDLVPRIGVYDEWAIEWGYRWMSFGSRGEEKAYMNRWIMNKLAKEPRLVYSDPFLGDPRNQMEDLGDDAMKAGYYGIKNLQRIMPHLKEWSATANNKINKDLEHMFGQLIIQYRRYLDKAAVHVGGLYRTPRTIEQGGKMLEFIPRQKQKEAVQFLSKELFDTPKWMDDKELFPYIGGGFVIWLNRIQEWYVHNLVNASTWNALVFAEMALPKGEAYTFNELLDDVEANVWRELNQKKPIDMYRRNLQKIYVYNLINITRYAREGDMQMLDAFTVATTRIRQLSQKIAAAAPGYKDADSRHHLDELRTRLNAALNYQKGAFPGVAPAPNLVIQFPLNGLGSFNGFKTNTVTTEAVPLTEGRSCWKSGNLWEE